MCGIVGYVGERPAVDILLRGLKRLEYRGYDSAGVAYLLGEKIEVRKSQGKLENVAKLLTGKPESMAHCGIGHTRWATHGKPTTQNAHPHRAGHVVIVHNGIIENYQEIRRDLINRGHKPVSETDSELFGFLVLERMDKGAGLLQAVREAFLELEGQCSVVVMSEKEPGTIIGVRNGSPLVAAVDPQGGSVLASDAQPLIDLTRDVTFLEHGDIVVGTRDALKLYSLETGQAIQRQVTHIDWSVERLDKQGYPHYMLKEIHEQPATLVDTLNGLLDRTAGARKPGEASSARGANCFEWAPQPALDLLDQAQELVFVACGTSYYAALEAKYWIERLARIPVQVDLASEYRYRKPVLRAGTLVIGISQSGETADTLAVLRDVRAAGFKTVGIANVRGSSISREADAVIYTMAGPEIGVAATKTFSAQLTAFILLAGYLGVKRGQDLAALQTLFDQLVKLPHLLAGLLEPDSGFIESIRATAKGVARQKGFFFIGRGHSFPIAMEGALKLKEIAYVHAEGYAAGELKHGPIAMIDESMAVVVLAPQDGWHDKTLSNLEEVKARGARIVGIGHDQDENLRRLSDHFIAMPMDVSKVGEMLYPFLLTPVIQLLSYELACIKGTDVDKPRNLAKSVTVE